MKAAFACFNRREWLNDEVCNLELSAVVRVESVHVCCAQAVNFYGKLVMRRHAQRDRPKRLHWFNSFFYATLMQPLNDDGFSPHRVRKWTQPRSNLPAWVDIFKLDQLMFPVHAGQVRCSYFVPCSVRVCSSWLMLIGCCAESLHRNSRVYARKED